MAGPIRFGGLASGLDTEKIVKELMKAQRAPVNKLRREKQTEEWRRDTYRDMNSLLLDLQKKVNGLRYEAEFTKKKASSSNDSIASASIAGKPQFSNYSVVVESLAKPASPASAAFTTTLADNNTAVGTGNGFSFTLNGKAFSVSDTDTIDSIITKINNESQNTKVTASYFNKQIVFTSTATGAAANVTIDVSTANGANVLGMSDVANTGQPAADGSVVINGTRLAISSNSFTFDGVQFTAKQAAPTQTLNVSVTKDEDAILDSIKGFVDKYNEVIDKINAKLSEKKYKGYNPLLDEEKESLKDTQIVKLEAMAKSGILLRDPMLQAGLDELRNAIALPLKGTAASPVDSAFDTLGEIGITGAPPGGTAYMEKGKLYIDENKLRAAINQNGDKVVQLFTQFSNNIDPKEKYKESGIAERLYDSLKTTIEKVSKKAGSAGSKSEDSDIEKKLSKIDDDIDTWEDRLKVIEDRYWKKFTAMEKAISKANSQGSWFAQMLNK